MGIACNVVSNVVRFVTVRNWNTFCELSVHTGHYVTCGYLDSEFTIK